MPPITVNNNKPRKVPTRKLIPEGKYLAKVQYVEKTLSNKGKLRLSFELRVLAPEDMKGKGIWEHCYLSDDAMWRLFDLAEALGLADVTFDPDDAEQLLKVFSGKKLKITIKHQSYTDDKGNERESEKISMFDAVDPELSAKIRAKRNARFGSNGGGARAAEDTSVEDEVEEGGEEGGEAVPF